MSCCSHIWSCECMLLSAITYSEIRTNIPIMSVEWVKVKVAILLLLKYYYILRRVLSAPHFGTE